MRLLKHQCWLKEGPILGLGWWDFLVSPENHLVRCIALEAPQGFALCFPPEPSLG